MYTSDSDRNKLISFLGTQLVGCAKEKDQDVLRALFNFCIKEYKCEVPENRNELFQIVHYRFLDKITSKTALNWANENDDMSMALELVRLEKLVHQDKLSGHECFKQTLSETTLKSWIKNTYDNFFPDEKCAAFFAIAWLLSKLFFFYYLPIFYDYYSDITLAFAYHTIAYANVTEIKEILKSPSSYCNSTNLVSDSFDQDLSMEAINLVFETAYGVTLGTVFLSSLVYIIISFFQPCPDLNNLISQKIISDHSLLTTIWSYARECWSYGVKLFWPIQHMINLVKHCRARKKSEHVHQVCESHNTLTLVKSSENGLEGSFQLFLQCWLLKPFFRILSKLGYSELVVQSLMGLGNWISFGLLPASYLANALGKFLMTICFMALSVALMKSGDMEPQDALPLFLSTFVQIVARMIAMLSLFVLKSSIINFLIFLLLHYAILFIVKILCETYYKTCTEQHSEEQDINYYGCQRREQEESFTNNAKMYTLKFMLSILCSSTILINIKKGSTSSFSFQTSFFILTLIENLALTSLPLLLPSNYLEYTFFPPQTHNNRIYSICFLWIIGVVFEVGLQN